MQPSTIQNRLTQLLQICSKVISSVSINFDEEIRQFNPTQSLKVSTETLDLLNEYASLRVAHEQAIFQSVYDFYVAYKENFLHSRFGQLVANIRNQEQISSAVKRKSEETEEEEEEEKLTSSKKRRKQTPAILKEWLFTHLENPYPNTQEREFLKQETGLSSRQLSQWFANARRRMGSFLSTYVKRQKENFTDLISELSEVAQNQPLEDVVNFSNENSSDLESNHFQQEQMQFSEMSADSLLWMFGKHEPELEPLFEFYEIENL